VVKYPRIGSKIALDIANPTKWLLLVAEASKIGMETNSPAPQAI
jgi:hypothetical protein